MVGMWLGFKVGRVRGKGGPEAEGCKNKRLSHLRLRPKDKWGQKRRLPHCCMNSVCWLKGPDLSCLIDHNVIEPHASHLGVPLVDQSVTVFYRKKR